MSTTFSDKQNRLQAIADAGMAKAQEGNIRSNLEKAGYGSVVPELDKAWAASDPSSPLADMESQFARANLKALLAKESFKIDPDLAAAWENVRPEGITFEFSLSKVISDKNNA